MKIHYYNKDTLCTIIHIEGTNVSVENFTDNPLHRAFGNLQNPTYDDYKNFLRSRCFPEERGNKKDILRLLGVDYYEPIEIIKKTEGRMAEDNCWMQIFD